GKRTLAFRIALDSVWEETAAALEGMTDPEAMVVMLATTGAVYLGLWMVPEPLLSKGIAAVLTVGLIGYLGWDTVWSLIQGWRLLAEQGGFILAAAEQVRAVAVSSSGVVTIELSPGAVAMAAQGPRSGALEVYEHHIATNKWWEATHNGGPWSPRFQELFDRAGMSLDDPANRVGIQGHKGPHPQQYHAAVYKRLKDALGRCRSIEQCRGELKEALQSLARELLEKGSQLNQWIARD
ncbi:AHH domain-containing protein, partial [Corallococcus terminator]